MIIKASLSVLFCFTTGLVFGQDPLVPGHGDKRVDVLNYAIDLTTGSDLTRINGTARLALATTEPMRSFSLDLRALTVSRVLVNGQPALFRQANEKLHITPRLPLFAGIAADVAITYGGRPAAFMSDALGAEGWQVMPSGNVTTLGEPLGASTWFPCNDWVADKATYQFSITVPAALTAVASGQPMWESSLPQGRRRYSFAMNSQISTWMAGVSIGSYKTTHARSSSGIPVRVYMDPLESPELVAFTQKHMTGSIDFFTKHFGTFQYPNCSIVAVGKKAKDQVLGLENPSMIVVDSIENREWEGVPGYNFGTSLISHEMGHMWFGNPVSVKEWKDIWLAEGLTTYAEMLYLEHSSPIYDRNFDFADLYEWLKEREAEGKSLGPLIRSTYDDLFDPVVYYRGALAIYALENEIGKAATLAILRSWVDRYRKRMVTTEDFIKHVTNLTRDPDVKPLLMRWIYDTDMPPFPGAAVRAQELTAVKAASFNESATRSSRLQSAARHILRK